jgi:hypothetical protein
MHVYIYDGFLGNHKYSKILAKIETRLTDLGLNGKICRLGVIKNYQDLIMGEIRRGAKTIIAVGNDETLSKVINSMGGYDIPIGFIPVGKEKNSIAAYLGIEPELAACDILSARRLTKLDLAQANQYYFLTEASISGKDTLVALEKGFSIEAPNSALIKIINLPLTHDKNDLARFNPNDGQLELYIKTEEDSGFLKKKVFGESIFTAERFFIENKKQQTLLLDNSVGIIPPVEIKLAKQSVTLIVGKSRAF